MLVRILLCIVFFAVAAIAAISHPTLLFQMESTAAIEPAPLPSVTPNKRLVDKEKEIEQREIAQKSIRVDTPEVFDDAMLQQMLQEAEAKLASLQAYEQTSLKFGAVSGASQQVSGFGVNIQGAPIPGLTVTDKSGTGSTDRTDKINAGGEITESSLNTKTGQATEDIQKTIPQFSPPTAVAPAPGTTLPSNPTIAASRILNEQTQLSAQIQMLRLLLRGSLSSQFILPESNGSGQLSKLKTTLGIPITITPNRDYKNAVAIVEVEVEKKQDVGGITLTCLDNNNSPAEKKSTLKCKNSASEEADYPIICNKLKEPEANESFGCSLVVQVLNCQKSDGAAFTCKQGTGGEAPMITALLPQEKTYNVAAIKESNTSIGGGIATQIVGISASWLRGRKTYYLVQDQDTVALSFKPKENPENKVGFLWQFRPVLGQEFVLSERKYVFVQMAFPAPPLARSGQIGTVKIRTYWRKYDRKKGIVGGIIPNSLREDDIPSWDIPRFSQNPTFAFNYSNLESLGGGKMMVNIGGKFLPGSYIRIGETVVTPKLDYSFLRFTATVNDLATKKVFLIAPNGEETRLVIDHWKTTIEKRESPEVENVKVETDDESNSKISMDLKEAVYLKERLVIVAGGRVYQPSNPTGKTLTVIVPTASLVDNQSITLTSLVAPDGWAKSVPIPGFNGSSRNERLVIMEQKGDEFRFLLYGNRLRDLRIIKPDTGADIENLLLSEIDTIRVVKMTKAAIQENKFLILQRSSERPFVIAIPSVEFKDKKPEPKMLERVLTNADEALVEGVNFNELDKVTFRGNEITFEKSEDLPGVKLTGLRAKNVTTGTASTQPLVFLFKSGYKVTVKLEVVNSKVENIPK